MILPLKRIYEGSLIYTEFAKQDRIQETVELEIEIYEDSLVRGLKVVKSVLPRSGGLDEAAKVGGKSLSMWGHTAGEIFFRLAGSNVIFYENVSRKEKNR